MPYRAMPSRVCRVLCSFSRVIAAWTLSASDRSTFFVIALARVRGMRTLQQETQHHASSCAVCQKLPMLSGDRFYRVDASRNSKGSGLGLALVQSIMQIHKGEASIVSEVGRGTTVTLTFPTRTGLAGHSKAR